MPSRMSEVSLVVKFLKVTGGAMLGNFSSVKIVFPAKVYNEEESNFIFTILVSSIAGVAGIAGIIVVILFICKCHKR